MNGALRLFTKVAVAISILQMRQQTQRGEIIAQVHIASKGRNQYLNLGMSVMPKLDSVHTPLRLCHLLTVMGTA